VDTNCTWIIFPDIFNNLHTKAVSFCGAVRQKQKVIPSDFGRELRLNQGDTKTRVKVDLTAVAWNGK
jgi:hypothetical protein